MPIIVLAIKIVAYEDDVPCGGSPMFTLGGCVGSCATICYYWEGKALVNTTSCEEDPPWIYFWMSASQGKYLVILSSLHNIQGYLTFLLLLFPLALACWVG